MATLRQRLGRMIVRIAAKRISKRIREIAAKPIEAQDATFHYLISKAKNTHFGEEHGFNSIGNYEDFKSRIPIRDYERLKTYGRNS